MKKNFQPYALTKMDFESLIKLASKPLKASRGKPRKKGRGAGYSGKKTRQHTTVNTSGKRNGKSRQ